MLAQQHAWSAVATISTVAPKGCVPLGAFGRPHAKAELTANKEKILIVRLSALGDVVRCLPALAALRAALPQARIGWVVETASADILQGHPDLDEVIVMPRKEWSRRAKNPLKIPGVLLEMRRFFRDLRG